LIDVGTGRVAQDRTFDPATGKQTGAFVYQDGVLIASADFTNGKQFRYTIFAPASGSPLEMREWDPDTRSATITRYYTDGKLTATRLFDANGRKTNYQLIDSEGRTAQDRVFDPETGKQTQFLNYRDGELIGYGQFVDGKQYGYTSIDALTGQPIEAGEWNIDTGRFIRTRYYTDGKLTADLLYNEEGKQTNFRLIDPESGQIKEDRKFDTATGHPVKTRMYEGGTLVVEADFVDGKQATYWRYNRQTGQPEFGVEVDVSTGKVIARTEFTDGRRAEAAFDSAGIWIDTKVRATADPSSPVITRYWRDENGRMHRWWTDDKGHTGESTYNGGTTESGLRWSNFTDAAGYRHEQDYTGKVYVDDVYSPGGNYIFRAMQHPQRAEVILMFPSGGYRMMKGTLSDAANAAASLSGASGIVSIVVPHTPVVIGGTALTGFPGGTAPTLLPPGTFGHVTTMVPGIIVTPGGSRPGWIPVIGWNSNPSVQSIDLRSISSNFERAESPRHANSAGLRVQSLIQAMATFDTSGAIQLQSSHSTSPEESILAASA
jgi:antitoxin component YwqK of YwqJK toxin-antitoxin module